MMLVDVVLYVVVLVVGMCVWLINWLCRFIDVLKVLDQIVGVRGFVYLVLQIVQVINVEVVFYVMMQIVVGLNMMIMQVGGMVVQVVVNYFEVLMLLVIVGKSVLMKDLVQKIIDEDVKGMVMDVVGLLLMDLFVVIVVVVVGVVEVIEGEVVSVVFDRIDESLQKYQVLLDKKGMQGCDVDYECCG